MTDRWTDRWMDGQRRLQYPDAFLKSVGIKMQDAQLKKRCNRCIHKAVSQYFMHILLLVTDNSSS